MVPRRDTRRWPLELCFCSLAPQCQVEQDTLGEQMDVLMHDTYDATEAREFRLAKLVSPM